MEPKKQSSLLSFFSKSIKKSRSPNPSPSKSTLSSFPIPGLFYIENFITKEESLKLLSEIYQKPWNLSLKRRTQHYGYSYNYQSSHLDVNTQVEAIPDFVKGIFPKLQALEPLKDYEPDQLIINEYLPGQGIGAHVDKINDFEDRICSLSLGSDTIMEFKKDGRKVEVILRENSLVILTKDARYLWTHGIPGRKSDKINGGIQERKTRVSLTFRKIK